MARTPPRRAPGIPTRRASSALCHQKSTAPIISRTAGRQSFGRSNRNAMAMSPRSFTTNNTDLELGRAPPGGMDSIVMFSAQFGGFWCWFLVTAGHCPTQRSLVLGIGAIDPIPSSNWMGAVGVPGAIGALEQTMGNIHSSDQIHCMVAYRRGGCQDGEASSRCPNSGESINPGNPFQCDIL